MEPKGGKTMRKAKYIKPMTISFPPDVFEAIKEIADREEVSMSEVVRKFTDHALKRAAEKTDS
jgi:predicted CopG family antitoxin